MNKVKVGIVEDEMLIANQIVTVLNELGYETTDPAISYTEALETIAAEKPDILLLDIVLSGSLDGIDLATKVKEDYNIPFIFLTANSDMHTVERAKKLGPAAYLMKPFNKDQLYTSIEVCLHNFSVSSGKEGKAEQENYIIKDSLFIKQGNKFVKIKIDDIVFMESDKKYVFIHSRDKKMLVRSTIQGCLDLIASSNIVRVHRSFAANINYLESIDNDELMVAGKSVPIGKTYREELLKNIKIG